MSWRKRILIHSECNCGRNTGVLDTRRERAGEDESIGATVECTTCSISVMHEYSRNRERSRSSESVQTSRIRVRENSGGAQVQYECARQETLFGFSGGERRPRFRAVAPRCCALAEAGDESDMSHSSGASSAGDARLVLSSAGSASDSCELCSDSDSDSDGERARRRDRHKRGACALLLAAPLGALWAAATRSSPTSSASTRVAVPAPRRVARLFFYREIGQRYYMVRKLYSYALFLNPCEERNEERESIRTRKSVHYPYTVVAPKKPVPLLIFVKIGTQVDLNITNSMITFVWTASY